MKRFLAGLLLLALAACSRQAMLDKIAAPADQALARAAIEDLAAGRDAALEARMSPPLRPQAERFIPAMRPLLPRGRLRLVEARSVANLSRGGSETMMVWEASRDGRYALVSTTVARHGRDARLTGLYLRPIDRPAESLFPFEFFGRPFADYLVFFLAVAAFGACVGGFVIAVRARDLKYRWLWAIGSLAAVAQMSVRWDTGDIFFKPLNLQLLGAFAVKPGVLAPWQVGFGIPVVAILLIVRRLRGHPLRGGRPVSAPGA